MEVACLAFGGLSTLAIAARGCQREQSTFSFALFRISAPAWYPRCQYKLAEVTESRRGHARLLRNCNFGVHVVPGSKDRDSCTALQLNLLSL